MHSRLAAPADKLSALVRIPTVSSPDPQQEDQRAFSRFTEALVELFPAAHAAMQRELVGDRGILFRWPGDDAAASPVLLLAHWDVVPPGDHSLWDDDPFSGRIEAGRVHGRGSFDDRSMLAAILEAVDRLAAAGGSPACDLYIALGGDEEQSGRRGAATIAALLAERGLRLDLILDEGGAVATDQLRAFTDRPVALIGTAEKGFLNLELTARGEGGHASTPHPDTPVHRIAQAISALSRKPFRARIGATAKGMFQALGTAAGGLKGMLLSHPRLFGPLLVRALGASPETNALVRTTAAPTVLQAGDRPNVVPGSARAVLNVRILPGESSRTVIARITEIAARFGVEVTAEQETLREPTTDTPAQGPAWELLADTAREIWPSVVVAPHLMTGGTDSYWYRSLSDTVFRFIPMEVDTATMRGVHSPNESLQIARWELMIDFFVRLLGSLDRLAGGKR